MSRPGFFGRDYTAHLLEVIVIVRCAGLPRFNELLEQIAPCYEIEIQQQKRDPECEFFISIARPDKLVVADIELDMVPVAALKVSVVGVCST